MLVLLEYEFPNLPDFIKPLEPFDSFPLTVGARTLSLTFAGFDRRPLYFLVISPASFFQIAIKNS
jgi:hypothetical protein